VLAAHACDAPEGGTLEALQPTLERVFARKPNVAAVVAALQAEQQAVAGWDAAATLQLLLAGSPTSLAVTHAHYAAVAADDALEEVLRTEHAVCTRLITHTPGEPPPLTVIESAAALRPAG
jgi:hypothetical protein